MQKRKTVKLQIHLICNSHIDPVWLWEWEEGLAITLATFRSAADLCEEFEGFIFNHNEALLYRWVEEYDPSLFKRIRDLVRRGRWHIMGGWYLQPDCNMPAGESFVRQLKAGRDYFSRAFDVEVRSAINFDPFGHSRGLVQILARSGFDSYLFCRPAPDDLPLPGHTFRWRGYDGSEILAARASAHYNSRLGEAGSKLDRHIEQWGDESCSLLLWGVGNHGGGPSRTDLRELAARIEEQDLLGIRHSTPENYFEAFAPDRHALPPYEKDLNPWAVGCYTSQARVKRLHRRLENSLLRSEKMAATAAFQQLMPWPAEELNAAEADLLMIQFHDILPGTSTQPVEEYALGLARHGLQQLDRLAMRAFYALCDGERPAAPGEFPLLVFNPHPFPVTSTLDCEFQPPEPNRSGKALQVHVMRGTQGIAAQSERVESNLRQDFRKRVVFRATLPAGRMQRFSVFLRPQHETDDPPGFRYADGRLWIDSPTLGIGINRRSGLLDSYRIGDREIVAAGAFRPLVMHDNADPWGMTVKGFRRRKGMFRLMNRREAARFAAVSKDILPPLRVIEQGPVRTVVEVLMAYGSSSLCIHYVIPRQGTEIEVALRVFWNEKDSMLKLAIPLSLRAEQFFGQDAYGVKPLPMSGDEAVAQQWLAVGAGDYALTCINDSIYGSDFKNNELRLSLLRSPAYAGHPVRGQQHILPQDRFTTRIDQGEHRFRFWLNAGPVGERMRDIDREALVKQQEPYIRNIFPSGAGSKAAALAVISDKAIQISALKQADHGDGLIIRLFEPSGRSRRSTLTLPFAGASIKLTLRPFEIKTLLFSPADGSFKECDLMERPL